MEDSNCWKYCCLPSGMCQLLIDPRRQSQRIQKMELPQRRQDPVLHQVHLWQNGIVRWKDWLQFGTFGETVGSRQKWNYCQTRNREVRWQKYTKIQPMPMGLPWFWLLQKGSFGFGASEHKEKLNKSPTQMIIWRAYDERMNGLEHDHLTLKRFNSFWENHSSVFILKNNTHSLVFE